MFFIKWLRTGSLIGLLFLTSGCAWYQGLDWAHQEREHRFPKRRLSHQDPEMQRFYELQQRIDALEARISEKDSVRSAVPQAATKESLQAATVETRAERVLSYVREKTRSAIAMIDRLLESMDESGQSAPEPRSPKAAVNGTPAMAEIPSGQVQERKADIAGTLSRDPQGQVVGSTSDGNRYNYSVVYVYPETKPWFDMWSLLEANGVQDKWRGKNPEKESYFIYVGAYYTESPARERSASLQAMTGARPEIRTRQGYQPVAMQ